MKKLIAVLGSSRPGSISMKAAEAFIKGAEEAVTVRSFLT